MSDQPSKAMNEASASDELTFERRKEILQREISKYVKRGFRVVSQTDTTAQLVKPKVFSCFWAIVWFLLAIVPFVIYLIWYAAKRDDQIYLEVTPTGRITTRKG